MVDDEKVEDVLEVDTVFVGVIVDIEVDNEVTILEVDDDDIYVVDDDEKVEDVLVVDKVFVSVIVEGVGTF